MGWTHNATTHTFAAPRKPGQRGRAILRLRYLKQNKDAQNYQGHSYTWMAFDEAGNFPSPEPLDLLWACLRSAAGVPCVRRITGNPGGPGHTWLKSRYIEPSLPFQPFEWQPQPEARPDLKITSVFIPAKLDDNLILQQHDPGYENRIAAAGGSLLFKAWRYGDWDVIAGAAFDEWNRDVHVVRWNPPPTWKVAIGMDWGYRNYGWIGMAFLGPKKRVYWRKEWYFRKIPPERCGFMFGEMLKGWLAELQCSMPQYIALDEAAFAVTQGGKSIGALFQQGLTKSMKKLAPPVIPAPKGSGSRHARAQHFHEGLRWGPAVRNVDTGKDEVLPHLMPLHQFHPDCKNLIRTLPALPVDEKDLEDVDTDAEDHPYDGAGYLLLTHYLSASDAQASPAPSDLHPGIDAHGKRRKAPGEGPIDPALGPRAAQANPTATGLPTRQGERALGPSRRRWSRINPEE